MLFDDDFNMNLYMKNLDTIDGDYDDKLYDLKTALSKGNIFKNEYVQYKNYNPTSLKANTKKDDLLLKIYEVDFAINDLGLYLDLHPEDNNIYEKYIEYVTKYNEYKQIYEDNFGPLEKACNIYSEYVWLNNPWPWDEGGSINV